MRRESVGQADKSILVAVRLTAKDASHTLNIALFQGVSYSNTFCVKKNVLRRTIIKHEVKPEAVLTTKPDLALAR